jgi:hypothetical protein
MGIRSELNEFVGFIKRKGWNEEDYNKLLRIVLECYRVDEVFDMDEQKKFNHVLKTHHVEIEAIETLDFQNCLADLSMELDKKKTLYHAIADALFLDEDFDPLESNFVDKIINQFELDGVYLRQIIKKVRDEHIDKAIRKWYKTEVD